MPVTISSPAIADAPALDLHVEEYGAAAGETLVLIHGFGANGVTWKEIAGPLAGEYRVLVVDLKGFGRSPKPHDGRYSVHDQAALIQRVVEQRVAGPVTLIGHSFGGAVALVAALRLIDRHPGWLSRLVIVDGSAFRQPLPWFTRLLQVPLLGRLTVYLTPPSLLTRMALETGYFDASKISDATVRAYAAPLASSGARGALLATAREIVPVDVDEITARYAQINVPTLIVSGRHDRIVPLATAERLSRTMPNARLVVFDRCGHIPMEECPVETLAVVREFLASSR